jgi:hypothetical protein
MPSRSGLQDGLPFPPVRLDSQPGRASRLGTSGMTFSLRRQLDRLRCLAAHRARASYVRDVVGAFARWPGRRCGAPLGRHYEPIVATSGSVDGRDTSTLAFHFGSDSRNEPLASVCAHSVAERCDCPGGTRHRWRVLVMVVRVRVTGSRVS